MAIITSILDITHTSCVDLLWLCELGYHHMFVPICQGSFQVQTRDCHLWLLWSWNVVLGINSLVFYLLTYKMYCYRNISSVISMVSISYRNRKSDIEASLLLLEFRMSSLFFWLKSFSCWFVFFVFFSMKCEYSNIYVIDFSNRYPHSICVQNIEHQWAKIANISAGG